MEEAKGMEFPSEEEKMTWVLTRMDEIYKPLCLEMVAKFEAKGKKNGLAEAGVKIADMEVRMGELRAQVEEARAALAAAKELEAHLLEAQSEKLKTTRKPRAKKEAAAGGGGGSQVSHGSNKEYYAKTHEERIEWLEELLNDWSGMSLEAQQRLSNDVLRDMACHVQDLEIGRRHYLKDKAALIAKVDEYVERWLESH
jgi:hypothetical protein